MSSKGKKAGNLVALGSAAVVAVYGAGFMRTAAAAERYAEQSDERVLSPEDAAAVQAESKANVPIAVITDSSSGSTEARLVVAPAKNAATAPANKADATIAKTDAKAQAKTAAATGSASAREVSVPVPPEVTTEISPASATPANAPPIAPIATASAVTPTPPVSAPPATTSTPVAPIVAPAAAPVATPSAPTTAEAGTPAASAKLKDGEYTGYGTSRHGDVEVYLETTDGKITYVKISQCLTQYSCSWISDLPKQVLARQSPRVDGVSGATQSANAFYYAVVAALAKAK